MTDAIRNSVVLHAPESHMPAVCPTAVGEAASLRMNLWGGDPDVWSVTTPVGGLLTTTRTALRALGAAMSSLLDGTPGPIVSGPFTIDHHTYLGRASVRVEWSGGGPFFIDNEPVDPTRLFKTYARQCAASLSKVGVS